MEGSKVVIDCAGTNATFCQSVHVAKSGGTIVWVGLAADVVRPEVDPISTKELTIKSIFRYKNLYPTTIDAIASGKLT